MTADVAPYPLQPFDARPYPIQQMKSAATDDDLIRLARRGDGDAVGVLYERHAPRVYAIVRRLAGDDEQAADWAQEAWIRVVRALPGFRGESRFTTWLHRIAVNAALQGQRVNKRQDGRFESYDRLPEIGVASVSPMTRLALERAVDRLPTGMRRVLVLHDIEGYTHEEIGEMLGVNPGTCKSQLFKARAKLREMLDPAASIEGERVCIT
jgi:RNA polymerase sigma-70 factor (ECF subfamily)